MDRHIRVKVTTHALRCIENAGGVDEYFLKTPYHRLETELGLFWKAKIEKLYEELGKMEVVFFSPEDEQKFEHGFKELKLSEKEARREFRRKMYTGMNIHKQIELEHRDEQSTHKGGSGIEGGMSHESEEQLAAVSYGLAADHLGGGIFRQLIYLSSCKPLEFLDRLFFDYIELNRLFYPSIYCSISSFICDFVSSICPLNEIS